MNAGITAFVPKTVTSGATADGRFGRDDFIYDAEKDEYRYVDSLLSTRLEPSSRGWERPIS